MARGARHQGGPARGVPGDKAALVAALRERGPVAMVGDGVNDAAAAAADLASPWRPAPMSQRPPRRLR